jgi:hypothetical protein
MLLCSQRVISGIDGLIADIASIALTMETVGQGTAAWVQAIRKGQRCRLWYDVGGHKEIMSAGEVVICKFMERSEGHASMGAPSGFAVYGMLQCRFNKANKIVSGEMVFDVMSCMQQVQRASMMGPDSNIILPNSLEGGKQPTTDVSARLHHSNIYLLSIDVDQARLITTSVPPFRVTHANEAWCRMFSETRGQQADENTFISVEIAACLNISQSQDPTVSIPNEINIMLTRASRGVPGRVAYSRTRLDGSIAMVYVKAVLLANDEGSGEDHIMVTVYEYDTGATRAEESGVVYAALTRAAMEIPAGRAPPPAWGMMGIHHASSSNQFVVPSAAVPAMDDSFAWAQRGMIESGSGGEATYFESSVNMSLPPAWLIKETREGGDTMQQSGHEHGF